jgi:hypothetical protein
MLWGGLSLCFEGLMCWVFCPSDVVVRQSNPSGLWLESTEGKILDSGEQPDYEEEFDRPVQEALL